MTMAVSIRLYYIAVVTFANPVNVPGKPSSTILSFNQCNQK